MDVSYKIERIFRDMLKKEGCCAKNMNKYEKIIRKTGYVFKKSIFLPNK